MEAEPIAPFSKSRPPSGAKVREVDVTALMLKAMAGGNGKADLKKAFRDVKLQVARVMGPWWEL